MFLKMMHIREYIVFVLLIHIVHANFEVKILNTGPVISGGTIHFRAELYENGHTAEGTFVFQWQDNSILKHKREVKTESYIDTWSVEYPSAECPPGKYIMQVVVKKYFFLFPVEITSERVMFDLTSVFSGELELQQNNRTIKSEFVSNSTVLLHKVKVSQSDMEYLNTSVEVLTYWFVDCRYVGITDNMQYLMNFTNVGEHHLIEAFVVPNFMPFPAEPTTTTTSTTTTVKPTTVTAKPPSKVKRELALITNFDPSNIRKIQPKEQFVLNSTMAYNDSFPFICENHTIVPILSGIPYGFFRRKITIKEPVKNVVVSGNNWIQRSEVLSLTVTCKGSNAFSYCYYFKDGIYNATGNETCPRDSIIDIDQCDFPIYRYFYDNNMRTVVIIVNNDVSTVVYPVAITIYKVNKQAQLSVIVVPVGFSLVAVVLIIFGIAYYFQNRSRFIVEVADFNFGQQFADLEYKTFAERLKDSFTNAFVRTPDDASGSSEADPVWHTGDNKYDSIS